MVHVIKVYLDDGKNEKQIRRLAVGSDVVSSFPLLKEKIRILFQLPTIGFDVKWKDSENDEIVMSSDEELAQALANADDGLLKLFVSLGKSIPKVQQVETKPAQESKVAGEVHPHVVCDACNGSVYGDRYKCMQCGDFDLCSTCNFANKHPNHDMIKLVKPSFAPREWVFLGSRRMWKSMFGHVARGSFAFPSPNSGSTSSTSSDENQEQSPCKDMGNALHKFLSGDFVAAEKLFSDGLGSFLQNWPGGIDVKLETDADRRPKKQCKKDSKNKNKEEDTPSTSTSEKATVVESVTTAEENTEAQPPKCEESVKQVQVEPAQVCGIFANTQTPSENKETECMKVETEVKSCDTGEREKSPVVNDDNSACAEGWTLLQNEEAEKKEVSSVESDNKQTEKTTMYPSLEKVESQPGCSDQGASNNKQEEGNVIHTNDPAIINALIKMQAMGFTNEGGWLERLLLTKKGNINEALDALYPFTRQ